MFHHSASLACLQKSKALRAATEQAAFPRASHLKVGVLQVREAKPHLSGHDSRAHLRRPLTSQRWDCAASCPAKATHQENKRFFPSWHYYGGQERALFGAILQMGPCSLASYSDPDTDSAEGVGTINTAAGYLPSEVAQMLVLLLELQEPLVSTTQAAVWFILSLIPPTGRSCHCPTAQGITEQDWGEAAPWAHRADPSDEEGA